MATSATGEFSKHYFPDYTPIVDPLHALSYVYQAAQAATVDMEECWQLCKPWITWIWQGKVDRVLDDLDQRIAQTTDAAVLDTLNTSRGYLHNNRDRMRYDEYRRRGLPITTALMESTIKRINRRIKGTEKFWREGAEPQIQLSADKISETHPSMPTGKRKRTPKSANANPVPNYSEPCPAPHPGERQSGFRPTRFSACKTCARGPLFLAANDSA